MDLDDLLPRLARQLRLFATPIDFDALVKAGNLAPVSATRYRLLARPCDLPAHVWAQTIGAVAGGGKIVLKFAAAGRRTATATAGRAVAAALLDSVRCAVR
jgi:hypothetical protein